MVHRLRGFRSALAALLVAGGLYACSGGDLTGPERSESPRTEGTPSGRTPSGAPAPSPSLLPDGDLTPLRICGEETVFDLLADRGEVVGDVTVTNDEGELSVVYRLDEGWKLRATHLSVTDDVASIPATGSGNPKPGRFAEAGEYDPGTTSSRFDLSLENLGAEVGDRLIVAAHADVVQPGDPSDPDDDREEGAWADGERVNDSPHGSWATYFEAEVQGCETASQRIDSDGGTITAGDVTLEIPVGALNTDVRITVEPVSLGDLDAGELDGLTDEEMDAIVAGTVVDLGPDGLTFDEPVELMLTYDEADLSDGFDEADLALATLSDTGVDPLVPSTVDTVANTVTAEVEHFTLFAVYEPSIAPLDLVVEEQIAVGDSVAVLAPERLPVGETIAVSDEVLVELGPEPLEVSVEETITVTDMVSVDLGPPPLEVAITENITVDDRVDVQTGPAPSAGDLAFVALQGADSVAVLDRSTNALLTTLQVGRAPYAVELRPGGTEVYVTNREDRSVSVIDVASQSVVATIGGIVNDPIELAFSPDGSTAYVVDNNASLVGVVDADARTLRTTRLTGNTRFSRAISVTPSGDTAFVAGQDSLVAFDLGAETALDTVAGSFTTADAVLRPGGSELWLTDGSGGRVLVFDPVTLSVLATVTGIPRPDGLAFDDTGSTAWVADRGFDQLTPIDAVSRTVGTGISLPFTPGRVAVSGDGSTAYVSEERGGTRLAVVDLATGSVVATLTVGSSPAGVALAP